MEDLADRPISALRWVGGLDGHLELVDQRRLPGALVWAECRDLEQLCDAIRSMVIRGAPAIGVSAGFGLVLALGSYKGTDTKGALEHMIQAGHLLKQTRPTAVNLAWAVERVIAAVTSFLQGHPKASLEDLRQFVFQEAVAIQREDMDSCLRIGKNGCHLITDGMGIITHCNAGGLATAGQGTALSIFFEAKRLGKTFTVYVDETRPLLQGARLTAWELARVGIDTVLICDNMAGWLIRKGRVQAVITGADRIAANGDAANKIGTYSLAVMAAKHRVPFYIAAPLSSFDRSIKSGHDIPIEHRDPDEVLKICGMNLAPRQVRAWNPAFDVTDARLITAIVTEAGLIVRPNARRIRQLVAGTRPPSRP